MDDSTPALQGAILEAQGWKRERKYPLLVKHIRHYIKEEEGSGVKVSIYMILVLTLALHTVPPITPPRTTVILFRTMAKLPRDFPIAYHLTMFSAKGLDLCEYC